MSHQKVIAFLTSCIGLLPCTVCWLRTKAREELNINGSDACEGEWPFMTSNDPTTHFGTAYYSCVWLMYQVNDSFIQILCVPMSAHVVLLNKLWTNMNKIIILKILKILNSLLNIWGFISLVNHWYDVINVTSSVESKAVSLGRNDRRDTSDMKTEKRFGIECSNRSIRKSLSFLQQP